jgi:hypothetical protein
MRHISTELLVRTRESFKPRLQRQLDNFTGHNQYRHIPSRPDQFSSVKMEIFWVVASAKLYELLDHLNHVNRLELELRVTSDQMDALGKMFQDIRMHLPNIKHLAISATLREDNDNGNDSEDSETWQVDQHYASIYKHIMENYQLTTLKLLDDELWDETVRLDAQALTLVELEVPFLVPVNTKIGFHLSFPHVKQLMLHSINVYRMFGMRTGAGRAHVLDFGKAFPLLEHLDMSNSDVFSISSEELGTIIQIASTSPRLKYLKLNISRYHKALVSMPSITFQHLQSLELVSDLFEEEHLRLLASVLWPSLMSLRYSSQQISKCCAMFAGEYSKTQVVLGSRPYLP